MKIKTLIIDDSAEWRDILTKLVALNPLIELKGVCSLAIASILIGSFSLTVKAQTPSVDSLFVVYKNTSNDTSKLATLEKLYTHYRPRNVDSAQIILDMALNLARATQNTHAEIKFMIKQGILLRSNRSKPDLALETYLKALKLAETHQDSSTYSEIYYGIGRVQADQGHNEETKTAFQNAIRWAKTNQQRYDGLESLAVQLANEQKIVASEQVFLQAYDLIKTAKDIDNYRLRFYNNIGEFYKTYKKDTIKGLFYYREGTKYAVTDPQKDLTRYIVEMTLLSKNFFELGDYNNSALYAHKVTAFSHIKKDNVKEAVAKAYRRLFEINKLKGNDKQAILYADSAIVIRDSLFALINSDSLKKETYKLEAAFTLERKQKEVELLTQKEKTKTAWLAAISILTILLSVIAYIVNRSKHAIEKQKTELASLNKTKDKLFAILSHDLISPFDTLKNYTILMDWGAMTQETFAETLQRFKTTLSNTSNMLENILHWAVSQMGGMTPKRENVHVSEVLNEQIALVEPIANDKKIQILQSIPTGVQLNMDKNHLALIIRNLLQNALKFTNKGGTIQFSYQNTEGGKIIRIEDNGIGMTPEIRTQLFQIDKNTQRTGTSEEKGTGLGLILTKELVELNGGQVDVSSEVGKGTIFSLTFS